MHDISEPFNSTNLHAIPRQSSHTPRAALPVLCGAGTHAHDRRGTPLSSFHFHFHIHFHFRFGLVIQCFPFQTPLVLLPRIREADSSGLWASLGVCSDALVDTWRLTRDLFLCYTLGDAQK